jgi:xanthine dehydrogenase accessory factor
VRGSGDVGSAVAIELFRAGHQVVVHDRSKPAHPRRGTAITDALFEGRVERWGVLAKHAKSLDSLEYMLKCHRAVPVVDCDFEGLLRTIKPDVLVDARLNKRTTPETQRGLAPLTIGLGPNFVAGETTDVVVETAYGDDLGKVIRSGRARDFAGEPMQLGGHGRERFVYAPTGGTFRTTVDIGMRVVTGEVVGEIDDVPVRAPVAGRLRGLPHAGARIEQGMKIVEVDASETGEAIRAIAERPRRIAASVLTIVRALPALEGQ